MGLDHFLQFGPLFGLGCVGFLGGVLTYAHLVGVDYKMNGADHGLFRWYCKVGWVVFGHLRILGRVRAMLVDYVLGRQASWGHVD